MQRFWTIVEYLPALVFFTIACFFASRFLIAFFPSESFAWKIFLTLAPLGREFGVLYPTSTLANGALVADGFFLIGGSCLLLVSVRRWRRTRFVCFHLSLLALIFSMGDEKVWVASHNTSGRLIEYSIIPNFSALDPVFVWLFFGVICACLSTHRDMIRWLRHRHREVPNRA